MAKILVIDDSKMDLQLTSDILQKNGYQVFTAESGETGIEIARKEKPELAVVDTILPGIDGFETCKRIREIRGPDIKIIIYTGRIDAIDGVKAKRSGADDYIVKASDFPNTVLELAKRMLKEEK